MMGKTVLAPDVMIQQFTHYTQLHLKGPCIIACDAHNGGGAHHRRAVSFTMPSDATTLHMRPAAGSHLAHQPTAQATTSAARLGGHERRVLPDAEVRAGDQMGSGWPAPCERAPCGMARAWSGCLPGPGQGLERDDHGVAGRRQGGIGVPLTTLQTRNDCQVGTVQNVTVRVKVVYVLEGQGEHSCTAPIASMCTHLVL
jgi:hypothetical protein